MQKDVHFYVTYALAKKAGLAATDAEVLAWADQYTDDLTEPDLHGIQTQSAIAGNWADRQVQLSVLVPFHFVPGADAGHPWMTTAGSDRAIGAPNTTSAGFGRLRRRPASSGCIGDAVPLHRLLRPPCIPVPRSASGRRVRSC